MNERFTKLEQSPSFPEKLLVKLVLSKKTFWDSSEKYASAIVAILALGVTVYAGMNTWLHDRVSVRPAVGLFEYFPTGHRGQTTIFLRNGGLDPGQVFTTCSSNVLEPPKFVPVKDISTKTHEALTTASSRSALTDSGQRSGLPNRDDDTDLFTDQAYGYSIRYPAIWQRATTASAPGTPARLFLSTPHHNYFIVSIYRLPARVERYSSGTFDQIGHDHVDTVLSQYRTLLRLKKILREQEEDHSDDRAMIFWQGTSAFDEKLRDWALVSTHVIPYGSDFMVNMVFLGGGDEVVKDGRNMDQVMGSISFGNH